ncbi:MAG: LacI family DNA-binding transcriptional regulator [Anaerolineae bacterium]|nr:LacI family DNA-binding transcriptional regulator [Anaerolineae bacterium]
MKHSNGKQTITQTDVAELAGVSRSIVSYVINNGPRQVAPETRERVLEAIKQLEYRPNKNAQRLSSTTESIAEKYIGIVLAHDYMFRRPYYGAILASIHDHAHQHDLHIRFIRIFEDFKNPALFNELIHSDEIGGAVLLGLDQAISTPQDETMITKIVERMERVVCVEWEWPGISSVSFDRQLAAYQVASHLFDKGYQRVAYIGPEDKRLQGYRQAIWEHQAQIDDRLIHFAINPESGFDECRKLLQVGVQFDAICAGTDELSIGVLKCLYDAGLRVPQDVGIASIDNIDISAYTIPSLTTVDVPKDEIGRQVVAALLADDSQISDISISVRTTLIQRNSTMR